MHWTELAIHDESYVALEKNLWNATSQIWAEASFGPTCAMPASPTMRHLSACKIGSRFQNDIDPLGQLFEPYSKMIATSEKCSPAKKGTRP